MNCMFDGESFVVRLILISGPAMARVFICMFPLIAFSGDIWAVPSLAYMIVSPSKVLKSSPLIVISSRWRILNLSISMGILCEFLI